LIDGDFILDGFDTALFPGLPTTLKAHGGFLDAQGRGAAAKLAAVKKALAAHPGSTVTAVGHSLGNYHLLIANSLYLTYSKRRCYLFARCGLSQAPDIWH
jgi:hypothetical protein